MQLSNPMLSTVDLCTIIGLSTLDVYTLVGEKKNELTNEEELLVENRQVEEQHPWKTIENILIRIHKFNFSIYFVTLGMEEDQQVSSIRRPSNAPSQALIDIEHGEMTLLVGKEKLKLNLHQSRQLTIKKRNVACGLRVNFNLFMSLHLQYLKRKLLKDIN